MEKDGRSFDVELVPGCRPFGALSSSHPSVFSFSPPLPSSLLRPLPLPSRLLRRPRYCVLLVGQEVPRTWKGKYYSRT